MTNFDNMTIRWEQLDFTDFMTIPYIGDDGTMKHARTHLSIWLDTKPILKQTVMMFYPQLRIK